MAYYLHTCGRNDIQVVPLYDAHYTPQNGDLVILEPSRRFLETQRYFDTLSHSAMSHTAVRVGPVFASTIYLFDPSVPQQRDTEEDLTLSHVGGVPTQFDSGTQKGNLAAMISGPLSRLSRRHTQ